MGLDFSICHKGCLAVGKESLEQDDFLFCYRIKSDDVNEFQVLDLCFWDLLCGFDEVTLVHFFLEELLLWGFVKVFVRVELRLSFFVFDDLRQVLSKLFVVDPFFHGVSDTEVEKFFA